jgi:hypothetical protein
MENPNRDSVDPLAGSRGWIEEEPTGTAEEILASRLRVQAKPCERLGSRLYGELLRQAADDVEVGGPTWEVLRGHEGDPATSALALRLMGAVNRLALSGDEPELAAAYRGDSGVPAPWPAFRAVLERRPARLRELVELPVQTNEVGRCAALLPGFLAVAAESSLPLRLLEVGASAGLNLRWDSYRYRAGNFSWGSADSPLEIEFELEGADLLPRPERVEVTERRGCDPMPIDPTSADGRLALLAYVWPDQHRRIERLSAALRMAKGTPVPIDRAGAADWIGSQLADQVPGSATVIFHSIVIQYLAEEERAAFLAHIQEAGERAGPDAPLAWLRMEPAGARADLLLATWPGGEDRRIARVGYHGSPVELF